MRFDVGGDLVGAFTFDTTLGEELANKLLCLLDALDSLLTSGLASKSLHPLFEQFLASRNESRSILDVGNTGVVNRTLLHQLGYVVLGVARVEVWIFIPLPEALQSLVVK